ncbi:HAD hydrolase family protein [Deinococcus radiophilus]|uniref:HAD family phosphatase n=1 Tax=Deinococcus radiophilus TaxID=32062 RepID=A0A3S0KEG6_9DEIO|nr:HAD family hydrolase [Deinococcus radiophilus]RTR28974.1 HAD family phosphatase [Deinococcus radiophilus]UFA49558.1 Cof-type HAD-IIB family hydrolase [Deinococcus radiophilus]
MTRPARERPSGLPLLLAFDFDGTLVPDGHPELPPGLPEVLRRLSERGVKLAAVTGRDRLPPGIEDAIPFDGVATQNGGHVEVGGEVKHALYFTAEELEAVLAHSMQGVRLMMFSAGQMYVDLPEGEVPTTQQLARNPRPTAEAPAGRVQKVNFFHDGVAGHAEQLREHRSGFTVTGAQPPYSRMMTVTPKGAHKGAGLEILARELDIPLERTIVFGDSDNDVAMFEVAGYAVQSGDLPLLHAHADESIRGPEVLAAWLEGLMGEEEK